MDHDLNVIGALVVVLGDRLRDATEEASGMRGALPAALTALHEWAGGRTIETLAGGLRLSHSRTVRVVDKLEARGLATRARDPADGRGVLVHRTALVTQAEALIAKDARGRVAAGTADGPIRGAECGPYPRTEGRRAAEADPALAVGRYDCVAYKRKAELSVLEGKQRTGLFGYPYWLVIDYDTAKFVWCKVTPRVGEGGRALASVPVPEPCRDPAGPG